MATAYSEEVNPGGTGYNRIRLRVEYSGTSATCYIEFRRTSSWSATWGDDGASITFNGQTVSAPYWYTGTVDGTWRTIDSASGFTVPLGGGTFNWHFNNPIQGSVLDCGGTITIASQATPPTGLSISNIVAGPDSITADVSVTGWGTGGSTANSYSELSVCTGQSASQRKWQIVSGRNNTVTITVDNNAPYSTGNAFTITPNTTYYLTMYATNGDIGTGNSTFTQVTTLPAPSAKLYGSVNNQAKQMQKLYGAFPKLTVSGGSINSGDIVDEFIPANLASTGNVRLADSGTLKSSVTMIYLDYTLASDTISIVIEYSDGTAYEAYNSTLNSTAAARALQYGCRISSIIATPPSTDLSDSVSVSSTLANVAKKITKLYGSVNGQAKLIYEG